MKNIYRVTARLFLNAVETEIVYGEYDPEKDILTIDGEQTQLRFEIVEVEEGI